MVTSKLDDRGIATAEELDRALRRAVAYREDRLRAEQALETVRRRESDAFDRLRALVDVQQRASDREAIVADISAPPCDGEKQ